MNAATGICEITENTYTCPVPPGNTITARTVRRTSSASPWKLLNTTYTNDADFARSMSLMEAAREAVYKMPRHRQHAGLQRARAPPLPRPIVQELLLFRLGRRRHDQSEPLRHRLAPR